MVEIRKWLKEFDFRSALQGKEKPHEIMTVAAEIRIWELFIFMIM